LSSFQSTNLSALSNYADGGEFEVGGFGGTDSQLVQFNASPDETVLVETPNQREARLSKSTSPNITTDKSTTTINAQTTIITKDAPSFLRSKAQIWASKQREVNRAGRFQ
jgi:hypothetical protein